MKQQLLLLLLMPLALLAQQSTFVVKKPTAKTIAGYYCTDKMTDGRICFHFDSLGKVETLVNVTSVSNILGQFAKVGVSKLVQDYTLIGDTVKFAWMMGISGTGFQPDYRDTMRTTVIGVVKGVEIALLITTIIDGAPPSVKKLTIYRIKQ